MEVTVHLPKRGPVNIVYTLKERQDIVEIAGVA